MEETLTRLAAGTLLSPSLFSLSLSFSIVLYLFVFPKGGMNSRVFQRKRVNRSVLLPKGILRNYKSGHRFKELNPDGSSVSALPPHPASVPAPLPLFTPIVLYDVNIQLKGDLSRTRLTKCLNERHKRGCTRHHPKKREPTMTFQT